MYKTHMTRADVMKMFRWEGTELCAIFGGTRIFSRASAIFKGWLVVYYEEGRTSWGLDNFSPDVMDTCSYGFLRLAPRGHGAVKITR